MSIPTNNLAGATRNHRNCHHLISKPPPPHHLHNTTTTTPQHQQPALPSPSPPTTSPEPRETTEIVTGTTDRRQNHHRNNENATETSYQNHQETVTNEMQNITTPWLEQDTNSENAKRTSNTKTHPDPLQKRHTIGVNAARDLESGGVEGQKPLLTPPPLILHLE
jgi:hypothetical protein